MAMPLGEERSALGAPVREAPQVVSPCVRLPVALEDGIQADASARETGELRELVEIEVRGQELDEARIQDRELADEGPNLGLTC